MSGRKSPGNRNSRASSPSVATPDHSGAGSNTANAVSPSTGAPRRSPSPSTKEEQRGQSPQKGGVNRATNSSPSKLRLNAAAKREAKKQNVKFVFDSPLRKQENGGFIKKRKARKVSRPSRNRPAASPANPSTAESGAGEGGTAPDGNPSSSPSRSQSSRDSKSPRGPSASPSKDGKPRKKEMGSINLAECPVEKQIQRIHNEKALEEELAPALSLPTATLQEKGNSDTDTAGGDGHAEEKELRGGLLFPDPSPSSSPSSSSAASSPRKEEKQSSASSPSTHSPSSTNSQSPKAGRGPGRGRGGRGARPRSVSPKPKAGNAKSPSPRSQSPKANARKGRPSSPQTKTPPRKPSQVNSPSSSSPSNATKEEAPEKEKHTPVAQSSEGPSASTQAASKASASSPSSVSSSTSPSVASPSSSHSSSLLPEGDGEKSSRRESLTLTSMPSTDQLGAYTPQEEGKEPSRGEKKESTTSLPSLSVKGRASLSTSDVPSQGPARSRSNSSSGGTTSAGTHHPGPGSSSTSSHVMEGASGEAPLLPGEPHTVLPAMHIEVEPATSSSALLQASDIVRVPGHLPAEGGPKVPPAARKLKKEPTKGAERKILPPLTGTLTGKKGVKLPKAPAGGGALSSSSSQLQGIPSVQRPTGLGTSKNSLSCTSLSAVPPVTSSLISEPHSSTGEEETKSSTLSSKDAEGGGGHAAAPLNAVQTQNIVVVGKKKPLSKSGNGSLTSNSTVRKGRPDVANSSKTSPPRSTVESNNPSLEVGKGASTAKHVEIQPSTTSSVARASSSPPPIPCSPPSSSSLESGEINASPSRQRGASYHPASPTVTRSAVLRKARSSNLSEEEALAALTHPTRLPRLQPLGRSAGGPSGKSSPSPPASPQDGRRGPTRAASHPSHRNGGSSPRRSSEERPLADPSSHSVGDVPEGEGEKEFAASYPPRGNAAPTMEKGGGRRHSEQLPSTGTSATQGNPEIHGSMEEPNPAMLQELGIPPGVLYEEFMEFMRWKKSNPSHGNASGEVSTEHPSSTSDAIISEWKEMERRRNSGENSLAELDHGLAFGRRNSASIDSMGSVHSFNSISKGFVFGDRASPPAPEGMNSREASHSFSIDHPQRQQQTIYPVVPVSAPEDEAAMQAIPRHLLFRRDSSFSDDSSKSSSRGSTSSSSSSRLRNVTGATIPPGQKLEIPKVPNPVVNTIRFGAEDGVIEGEMYAPAMSGSRR